MSDVRDAVVFRRSGASVETIALKLNRSVEEVNRLLEEGVQEAEAFAVSRRLELSRLDALHETLWTLALSGDYEAIDRVLAIHKRRCSILGLDAAPKVQVMVEDQINAALDALHRALPAAEYDRVIRVLSGATLKLGDGR